MIQMRHSVGGITDVVSMVMNVGVVADYWLVQEYTEDDEAVSQEGLIAGVYRIVPIRCCKLVILN